MKSSSREYVFVFWLLMLLLFFTLEISQFKYNPHTYSTKSRTKNYNNFYMFPYSRSFFPASHIRIRMSVVFSALFTL